MFDLKRAVEADREFRGERWVALEGFGDNGPELKILWNPDKYSANLAKVRAKGEAVEPEDLYKALMGEAFDAMMPEAAKDEARKEREAQLAARAAFGSHVRGWRGVVHGDEGEAQFNLVNWKAFLRLPGVAQRVAAVLTRIHDEHRDMLEQVTDPKSKTA